MRVLYHTPLSPLCRKIRILLKEKELDFDLVEEPVWERRAEFFAINPSGEVPVLVDIHGTNICGNYAITEYIEEITPERPMMGATPAQRAEVRRIIDWFDTTFHCDVTLNLLYEKIYKKLMGDGEPNSHAIRTGKQNIHFHLDYIGYLTQQRQWLAGDQMTIADITAASHLSSLDYLADVPWENHKPAGEWYALMKSRPSFRNILLDRVSGFRPPAHYENPDF